MLRFSFRREKDKEFKHIAHGLIPAASIAPKPAVPRTPPPRSPNPSPERPRSALAAAILSSSLTGQTWAIPPARLMSLSESGQSESFTSEPNISTALYTRDRWSEDLVSRPRLSSPDQSEGELEDKEQEVVDEEDGEDHVYHTLDRRQNSSLTESVYALPLKAKVRNCRKSLYYVHEGFSVDWKVCRSNSRSKTDVNEAERKSSQAELQNLRQHAQELVDENDALKLTVHRLNVELSHYQARFRPLSKEEHSKVSGLPNTGSPPPWLVDMKYLSPLLLAYEDRMNEKDAILQTTEENMKKLHVQLEEVIKENEKLHDEITKTGAVNQKDCHQIQQQAVLVLQENQVLINQLEAQHAEAKATHSRHNTEVAKVSKKLMLLEVENQRLEGDLEESRREVQKNKKELQVLQARLKDAVTWDEHCSIAGKLRRQLEQHESRSKGETDKLLLRVSNLQEENRILALDKAQLTAKTRAMEAELELSRQANRKAERRMSMLKQQKEECVLKEEKTRHYLGAVISVAEHISQERDRLLHMSINQSIKTELLMSPKPYLVFICTYFQR
uniref:Centrosomal protein 89 n=1 Tax=Oreochromis aureus TaxID=47969 RepID=A0A668W3V8_OREAU